MLKDRTGAGTSHQDTALLSLPPMVMAQELGNSAKAGCAQRASWGIAQRGQS